jgi:hypothetical protein
LWMRSSRSTSSGSASGATTWVPSTSCWSRCCHPHPKYICHSPRLPVSSTLWEVLVNCGPTTLLLKKLICRWSFRVQSTNSEVFSFFSFFFFPERWDVGVLQRERAVVVEDAALLVMALQRKRGELVKRRAHLQAPHQDSPRSVKRVRPCSPHLWNQQSGVEINIASESPLSSSEGAVGDSQGTAASAINVHSGKENIVVEMAWNCPPPNFQSSLLRAVESLGSAVTRCSIFRVTTGLVQCFVTCSKVRAQPGITQYPIRFTSLASFSPSRGLFKWKG